MILGRALLVAAAAMLAAGRGALGFPEARAPLTASDCPEQKRAGTAGPPSSHLYEAMMP